MNDSKIAAEVPAVVITIHADVGLSVAKGDLLLELDATDYRLNLEQAEANLASSRAQLAQAEAKQKRAMTLGNSQYVSADELLERETAVLVYRAQIQASEVAVAIARRNLEKCSIRAPFDGVIVERMAQVGNFVRNGETLIALTQLDRFELDARIPDGQANELADSGQLHFASREQIWPVELLRMSSVIDNQGRTRRARFEFIEDAPVVGRSGEIVWKIGQGLLPSNLISRRDGELGVFLLDNGKAKFHSLPGAQEGRPAQISLPSSSRVITLGRERLQDGADVTVQR
jgi:RND family efflux transporter MFP subunit